MSTAPTRPFRADTNKFAYAQAFTGATGSAGAGARTRRHLSRLIRRAHRAS